MNRLIILIFLELFLVSSGWQEAEAQMPRPAGPGKVFSGVKGQGHWRTFDGADGLAGGIVFSILEDQQGHIWFATSGGGVSRYDGQKFVRFTKQDGLAHNNVWSMLESRDGTLWFGTREGLSRYPASGQSQFETFTVKDGLVNRGCRELFEDRDGNLWIGTDGGVSRYDGVRFETITEGDGLEKNAIRALYQDRDGVMWIGTRGRGVIRHDGVQLDAFTQQEGLAGTGVLSIAQDSDGVMWFGTRGQGVVRYDGKEFKKIRNRGRIVRAIFADRDEAIWFVTGGVGISQYNPALGGIRDPVAWRKFTIQDGLADNNLFAAYQGREGHLWFGTGAGGVSRYDGETFMTLQAVHGLGHNIVHSVMQDQKNRIWIGTSNGVSCYDGSSIQTFMPEDGLASNLVRTLYQDREGGMWFGTSGGGVSRYDGETFTTWTSEHGLVDDNLWAIFQDRDGVMWFGTDEGVCRYDGKQFETVVFGPGLEDAWVTSIFQDREGVMWFGTGGRGIIRYDGQTTIQLTDADGLADNRVWDIWQDKKGVMWFGTTGGVSRFENGVFEKFGTEQGLASVVVRDIYEDAQGHLWFGTRGGGVSRFDGQGFQSLTDEDGLANNYVEAICGGQDGAIWFGTSRGITRFLPPAPSPPLIDIEAVVANQRYADPSDVSISKTVALIAFEFRGVSFKTRPEAMQFRYRLKGYDEWHFTQNQRVEYVNLSIGEYVFEVQAVDRDLVYSERPAVVKLTVHPPYGTLALGAGLVVALIALGLVSGYAVKRRRELFNEMASELQTAHDLQMGLMPRENPRIPGVAVAGRCLPAQLVGGDFFQYFEQEGKLVIALADVTGHAMEAAIPAVMFSGVLRNDMEQTGSLLGRFERLNRSLHGALSKRVYVTLVMGEFDLETHKLRVADCGCPYPYHFQVATGDVTELEVDGFPFGVREEANYQEVETNLMSNDVVVFCSDGIVECENGDGERLGFGRTAELVRTVCADGGSPAVMVERILVDVDAFRGNAAQKDDMTCVVVKLEDDV